MCKTENLLAKYKPRNTAPLLLSVLTVGQLDLVAGHYMYIETSSPRKTGDYARLETPPFLKTDGNGQCLVFWYHMYGSGIGRLNVYIKRGNALGPAVWSESGNHGNKWLRGMVTVKSPTQQWKVI